MTELVQLTRHDDVALIAINNPPVNALSPGVPEGIEQALEQAQADARVRAVVVVGGGRTFVAGADIREFQKITSGDAAGTSALLSLLPAIEACPKPVVMAIHGNAFGGGLELALAGDYRVATPDAQLGQPEVKLGLIPGAGGTQRLPRLAGVALAVEMCSGGNPISAEAALQAGIIDRIIEGDLLAGALAFAREVAGKPVVKARDRAAKLGTPEFNAPIFAAARESASRKQRGQQAPLAAIELVEAATRLPFDEGLKLEQARFRERLFSEQSKALIHVFFSEREAARIPDIPRETPSLPVHSAAVVGAGTMGAGIAMVFANAGIPVLLREVDQAALDRGLAGIGANYDASVQRGRFTRQFVDERLRLITPTLSFDRFQEVDMVVEAVFETMALKKEVFTRLDQACRPDAILASNTSTLSIDEIAAATSRPEAVIGTHFFSPANVMRLLEIVRGQATAKPVIATCMHLAKRLGKVGVLAGNCRGFIGNRMYHAYRREAQFLVEEGATVEAVDRALYDFGMAMGPLATGDLAGLDVGWRIRKEYRHLEKEGVRRPLAEDRLCETGRYGQKTGAGWYRYDQNRRPISDPEVTRMVHRWAADAGICQRQVSASEILERCLFALVNEGACVLEEGIALRAGDIDVVFLNGYGFPAYRGGPMWYADRVGLRQVYARVCEFRERHGELWEPAPLLQQLAEAGETFAAFSRPRTAAA